MLYKYDESGHVCLISALREKTFDLILQTYNVSLGLPRWLSGKKNPPTNAGAIRNAGSTTGPRRSPGGRMSTQSSILAWRIPWTEEPGKLQSMGSQSRKQMSTHIKLAVDFL